MQNTPKHNRKHIALWVAVGGTMTVIVALWVIILPSQLALSKQNGSSFSNWYTARATDTQAQRQTFSDVMTEQKAQLDAVEQKQANQANAVQDAKNVQQIDVLKAEIEAATKANANTNAAAANTNAPKKP